MNINSFSIKTQLNKKKVKELLERNPQYSADVQITLDIVTSFLSDIKYQQTGTSD